MSILTPKWILDEESKRYNEYLNRMAKRMDSDVLNLNAGLFIPTNKPLKFSKQTRKNRALVISSENIGEIMSSAIEKLKTREEVFTKGYVGYCDDYEIYSNKKQPFIMAKTKKAKVKKLTPIQKLKKDLIFTKGRCDNFQQTHNELETILDGCQGYGVVDAVKKLKERVVYLNSQNKELENWRKSHEGFIEGRINFLSKENDRLWHMVRIAMKDPIIESIAENTIKGDDGRVSGRFEAPDFNMGFDPCRRPNKDNLF